MNPLKWHSGPPPHIGWWNASLSRGSMLWRWWDGASWSFHVTVLTSASEASVRAEIKDTNLTQAKVIFWRHYYPKNARVPRIDPRVETKDKK